MTFFKIISANNSHIDIISKLAHDIWHEHYPSVISIAQIDYMLDRRYSKEALAQEFKQENIFWFLLEYADEPMGYLSYHLEKDKIFLAKLYTHRKFHGKGLGKSCLDLVTQKAKDAHLDQIYLFVNRINHIAIKSYLRSGFVVAQSLVQDIGGGFVMDDYRMEKIILSDK